MNKSFGLTNKFMLNLLPHFFVLTNQQAFYSDGNAVLCQWLPLLVRKIMFVVLGLNFMKSSLLMISDETKKVY